ncbi:MAG: VTT domain-containing protein [Blastocatellia bacterium]
MKGFFLRIKDWLIGFGAFGVFGIALLDAALIPIPGGPDAVVMTLSHLNHAMMPVYVLAAVLGSTLGCLVPYWIGRASGEAALRRFSPEKRERATRLIDRYDVWAMLVGAVLPPPFPFKVLLISAGVFRMKVWRFLAALAIGRSLRFVLEGVLAVRYGEQAMDVFKHHYPKIGLGLAAAVIVALIINTLIKRRQKEEEISDGDLRTAG